MKVSECCGAGNVENYDYGIGYEDLGICPECGEHCDFIEEEDLE